MANLYCDFGMLGQVNGEYANREYVVPMATHEGALLASYSRGAKARTRSPSTKQYREREGGGLKGLHRSIMHRHNMPQHY